MASDVYLHIDGVNGESNDDKHKGWIEVEAVDWGVIQPVTTQCQPLAATRSGAPFSMQSGLRRRPISLLQS
jgi:type VI protein secretion system component Hcp